MSVAAWQRVTLPMLILNVLAAAPRHGYGIAQALVSAGLQPLKGGQLYPALVRLEDDGMIVARWEESVSGPARTENPAVQGTRPLPGRLRPSAPSSAACRRAGLPAPRRRPR